MAGERPFGHDFDFGVLAFSRMIGFLVSRSSE
jgi:hypothetical protein